MNGGSTTGRAALGPCWPTCRSDRWATTVAHTYRSSDVDDRPGGCSPVVGLKHLRLRRMMVPAASNSTVVAITPHCPIAGIAEPSQASSVPLASASPRQAEPGGRAPPPVARHSLVTGIGRSANLSTESKTAAAISSVRPPRAVSRALSLGAAKHQTKRIGSQLCNRRTIGPCVYSPRSMVAYPCLLRKRNQFRK